MSWEDLGSNLLFPPHPARPPTSLNTLALGKPALVPHPPYWEKSIGLPHLGGGLRKITTHYPISAKIWPLPPLRSPCLSLFANFSSTQAPVTSGFSKHVQNPAPFFSSPSSPLTGKEMLCTWTRRRRNEPRASQPWSTREDALGRKLRARRPGVREN